MLLFPCWAVPLAVAGEFVAECFPFRVAIWGGVLCGGLLWSEFWVVVGGVSLLLCAFFGEGDAHLGNASPFAEVDVLPPASLHACCGSDECFSLVGWNGGCNGHIAPVAVDGVWQRLGNVQEAVCACLVVHLAKDAGVQVEHLFSEFGERVAGKVSRPVKLLYPAFVHPVASENFRDCSAVVVGDAHGGNRHRPCPFVAGLSLLWGRGAVWVCVVVVGLVVVRGFAFLSSFFVVTAGCSFFFSFYFC